MRSIAKHPCKRPTTAAYLPPPPAIMVVETKRRKAQDGEAKPRETQTHTLRDGRVMQSHTKGVLKACSAGCVADVAKCLAAEDVGKVIDRHGSTALHWAAGAGHLDVCKLLVSELSADYLFVKNKDGRNALHWAARNGHLEVMQWLLDEGMDIDEPTNNGNTALHWSIWGGQLDALQWLVKKGADLLIENETKCSAVHWAAARGRVDVCKYLVSLDVDFSSINSAGHGAVTKAAWEGHTDLVLYLLTDLGLGSQLAKTDVHGCTPSELARQNGHAALADIMDAFAAQRGEAARPPPTVGQDAPVPSPPTATHAS